MKPRWGTATAGHAFVAPALLAIGTFLFLPIAAASLLSLTDFDIYAIGDRRLLRLVGLGNYRALLQDPLFWRALGNTAYFVALGMPLSIGVSLGAALLLETRLTRFRSFFRTVYFLPVVTTLVGVAVVWRYLYHPRHGLLNHWLGLVHLGPIDWLGEPGWAMPAIVLMAVWKGFGFNMVIFVAALQSIPERLYEAARIDGADAAERFRHVTLPMLRPTLLFVVLLTTIGHFQLFAEPYVMTGGGPSNSTLSVVLLMYEQGFRWWNMGYAAAVAFVLFAIILGISLVQLRLGRLETPGGARAAETR